MVVAITTLPRFLLLGMAWLALLNRLTRAHDVRPVDRNRTRIAMEMMDDPQNAQKVEEALLKLHFALMADSRQAETGRQGGMNMSADISKADFDYLVGKINEEVTVLRRQALILSKAYQSLLVKHKDSTKKLAEVQSDPLGICPNNGSSINSATQAFFDEKILPSAPATVFVPKSNTSPATCNCHCQFPNSASYSSLTRQTREPPPSSVGNKYYYFNYVQYPKYDGSQQHQQNSVDHPSYAADPEGRPPWFDRAAQKPKVKPHVTHSMVTKEPSSLQDLQQRLDHNRNRNKYSHQDKYHGPRKSEKLYTSDEVEMMFDHWMRHSPRY